MKKYIEFKIGDIHLEIINVFYVFSFIARLYRIRKAKKILARRGVFKAMADIIEKSSNFDFVAFAIPKDIADELREMADRRSLSGNDLIIKFINIGIELDRIDTNPDSSLLIVERREEYEFYPFEDENENKER